MTGKYEEFRSGSLLPLPPRPPERAGISRSTLFALLFAALASLLAACYSTRNGAPLPPPREITVRLLSGSALLSIQGNAPEEIYMDFGILEAFVPENPPSGEERSRRKERTFPGARPTCKAERHLAAGEEFSYTLKPGEILLINAAALGGEDALLAVTEYGAERTHTAQAANPFGLTLSFSNR